MLIRIIVKLTIEGTHQWTDCNLSEVDYLRSEHRHIFHIQATKNVKHTDRDIEIIKLKHEIDSFLKKKFYNKNKRLCLFERRSCEDIAYLIWDKFNCHSVTVLEDNENGAEIIRD